MRICVRAHDLGVKGTENIIKSLKDAGADGAQLVCYKSFDDIMKQPKAITEKRAQEIGEEFRKANLSIDVVGAYFNPVHSDAGKVEHGYEIFCNYLRTAKLMGSQVVGSETGSYSDEPWIYHPKNRTEEALDKVVSAFSRLCDTAAEHGAFVGIEGASGHVCHDVKTLDKAIKKIDKENIKIIFDIYNFLDNENYRNYLDILDEGLSIFDKKIHCFHIKDCEFKHNTYAQCSVGKGDMDYEGILSRIKEYNKDAILILEGTKKEDIKDSIKLLREKWKKM
ncbi:MAG: sugar phosphate isomerase/epimerase family protein [Eubacteriales bacterium]